MADFEQIYKDYFRDVFLYVRRLSGGNERLLLILVAYGLGHLCVLGFQTISYSEWRDFQMILAIGVLFYCAMLLALNVFYSIKELRDMRMDDRKK